MSIKQYPKNFPKKDKITYHIGKDNLKDSGKFYWSSELKKRILFFQLMMIYFIVKNI